MRLAPSSVREGEACRSRRTLSGFGNSMLTWTSFTSLCLSRKRRWRRSPLRQRRVQFEIDAADVTDADPHTVTFRGAADSGERGARPHAASPTQAESSWPARRPRPAGPDRVHTLRGGRRTDRKPTEPTPHRPPCLFSTTRTRSPSQAPGHTPPRAAAHAVSFREERRHACRRRPRARHGNRRSCR